MRYVIFFQTAGEKQKAVIEAANVRRAIAMVKTGCTPEAIVSVMDEEGNRFDAQGEAVTILN